jgi:hypothetical protein
MVVYFRSLGAPTRFDDLGFEGLTGENGQTLASATYDLLDLDAAVPFRLSASDLYQGLLTVDRIGKAEGPAESGRA